MAIFRKLKCAKTVMITVTVATVKGHAPLVGFSEEVEAAWERLKKKFAVKQRSQKRMSRTTSDGELASGNDDAVEGAGGPLQSHNDSDVGKVMLKFRQLEEEEAAGKKEDVYSKDYVPKKYEKHSDEYGAPKPGTLTEMRAKKASKHIAKEMLYICEVINENGFRSKDGRMKISFGKIFQLYQYISDKVVGILLRARKHKMLDFEGEMLYQRRDEDVIITCLLTPEEITIKRSPEEITIEEITIDH